MRALTLLIGLLMMVSLVNAQTSDYVSKYMLFGELKGDDYDWSSAIDVNVRVSFLDDFLFIYDEMGSTFKSFRTTSDSVTDNGVTGWNAVDDEGNECMIITYLQDDLIVVAVYFETLAVEYHLK